MKQVQPHRSIDCSNLDLTLVRRLWNNELRQRRSRSLSVRTGPESMTGGTSAKYSEVECSFEKGYHCANLGSASGCA